MRGKEIEAGCLDNSLNKVGFERTVVSGGGRWEVEMVGRRRILKNE